MIIIIWWFHLSENNVCERSDCLPSATISEYVARAARAASIICSRERKKTRGVREREKKSVGRMNIKKPPSSSSFFKPSRRTNYNTHPDGVFKLPTNDLVWLLENFTSETRVSALKHHISLKKRIIWCAGFCKVLSKLNDLFYPIHHQKPSFKYCCTLEKISMLSVDDGNNKYAFDWFAIS